jgi:hypothetical protein
MFDHPEQAVSMLHFSTVELITNNYDVVRSSISSARE